MNLNIIRSAANDNNNDVSPFASIGHGDTVHLSLNVTRKCHINIPTEYNGMLIKRNWKEAGGKPKTKDFTIINHENFRLVRCLNGYVLLCVEDECKNLALNGDGKCKSHSADKETYNHCRHPSCAKRPTFGNEHKKPLFCGDHKIEEMIGVTHKTCEFLNCKITPHFGFEGKSAQYCSSHRLSGMVNVRDKRCSYVGCRTRPNFGYEGQSPQYCSDHKLSNMVNVTSRRCEHFNCTTIPIFGYEGQTPQYCNSHKLDGMINVNDKRCEHPNCNILSTFGYVGKSIKYCSSHKLPGMIDLKHKKCEYVGCTIIPCFGFEDKPAQYCEVHKLPNMINVRGRKCKYPSCTITPSYGNLYTNSDDHCREHSTRNEYSRAKNNPVCLVLDCYKTAYFIDPTDSNIYPIRCATHELPNDIELINKVCLNCNNKLYFPSNKELCVDCGLYRERKLYCFKEQIIKQLFKSQNIPFIHNKPVSINGSKNRPDFLTESGFGYIVVEVDENQHSRQEYTMEYEISRMKAIYEDIISIKFDAQVLFIRYNPDKYEGLQHDTHQRHSNLCTTLRRFMDMKTIDKSLAKLNLYYDGFDENPTIEEIL